MWIDEGCKSLKAHEPLKRAQQWHGWSHWLQWSGALLHYYSPILKQRYYAVLTGIFFSYAFTYTLTWLCDEFIIDLWRLVLLYFQSNGCQLPSGAPWQSKWYWLNKQEVLIFETARNVSQSEWQPKKVYQVTTPMILGGLCHGQTLLA